MAIQYTPDQEKVIYTTGKSLLVSAAAGSGKTAVLVRRIIEMVTREENPVSLHELLIVTFTNAAAAEMRERIGEAITEAIEVETKEQVLQHLIEQMTLLSSAPIMTLHAFCLQILKSYYHLIDLDPNFRVGNETELVLMKEEVLDDVLEKAYEEKTEAFIACVEAYAPGKNDDSLRDMIYTVYRFSRSHPWPNAWLEKAKAAVHINSLEEAYQSEFYKYLVDFYGDRVRQIEQTLQIIRNLMTMPEGPDKYEDTVQGLEAHYKELQWLMDEGRYDVLPQVTDLSDIAPLSRKSKGYDKDLATTAKDLINDTKALIESFKDLIIHEESFMEDMERMKVQIHELIRLTETFAVEYAQTKEEKTLIDFSDIEHFALGILYNESGELTEIAQTYKGSFYEVLVDEYQDINDVQETILQGITKSGDDHNLFMVGDLKQSIYRFRLANPNIFANKYMDYALETSTGEKIDLSKNFRSRQHILDFTNLVFESVMSQEVGDVDYNDDVKLYYGASYDEAEEAHGYQRETEILVIEDPKSGDSKATLQAEAIATKIKELVLEGAVTIFDKNEGQRPINYSDICILSRSPSGSMDALTTAFDSYGIPYESDTSSGYFDAIEVQVVIALLKVIDNPYQDIPLVALMRSPFIGYDEELLLTLRVNKDQTLYENILAQLDMDQHEELRGEEGYEPLSAPIRERLQIFVDWINQLRDLAHQVPLHELLDEIYLQTGYIYMVPFMENGQQRYDNLRHLRTQSLQFEKTSYRGLFNFIRYIDHVKKYDIATPQPYHSQAQNYAVKMMSIHKSKGLEFPIVFLMDVHKQFNKQDLRQSVLLHPDMGIGSPFINPDKRTKRPSIFSKAIQLQSEKELLSEELRLLYVALTRSKEKLYLVGTVSDYEKKIEESPLRQLETISPQDVLKANSYLDLILMSCSSFEHPLYRLYAYDMEQESENALFAELAKDEAEEGLIDLLEQEVEEDEVPLIEFPKYTYEEAVSNYITMSVSELKHIQQPTIFEDGASEKTFADEPITKEREKPTPLFIEQEEEEARGAYYGRMIHTILQLLPMRSDWDMETLTAFVNQLCDEHVLPIQQKGSLYLKPVLEYTRSDIYQRMIIADEQGQLYREKPFVLQWNVDQVGDYRMIQGIIDVYFMENGKGILVDFKTDRVSSADTLVKRYQSQLSYYKKALEDIGHIEVTEVYIYSMALQKAIPLH